MNRVSQIKANIWVVRTALLGFSSGLPFLLTLSTLSIWLKESGASNTVLGLFVFVTFPYMFKFFWAPFIDSVSLPYLKNWFGQRRSWALVSQLGLMGALIGLGACNPQKNLMLTAVMAAGVSGCAAIQDLVLEAYRIEITDKKYLGSSASLSYLGFRLGMMVSGAGALYLASFFSWFVVYTVMAAGLSVGIITVLLSPEPVASGVSSLGMPSFLEWRRVIKESCQEFLRRRDWRIVVAFILFYKVGDTVLNVMNTPFLIELGFSKIEIAQIAKFFGITAMILGGIFGGLLITKYSVSTGLILCSGLQAVSCLMLFLQALMGRNLYALIAAIGVENFTCGMGASAFVAYLSSLASRPYTATLYGLLSSLGSFSRIFLSLLAGWAADQMPWEYFFLAAGVLCCPSMILLLKAPEHFQIDP